MGAGNRKSGQIVLPGQNFIHEGNADAFFYIIENDGKTADADAAVKMGNGFAEVKKRVFENCSGAGTGFPADNCLLQKFRH